LVFSSYVFLFVFLPLALAGYYAALWRDRRCGGRRATAYWLIVASYVFYGWARLDYIALVFASSLIDYVLAGVMANIASPARRRLLLTLSVVLNLGLLAFFKYAGFAVDSLNGLLTALGVEPVPDGWARVALPVGISFYTFQSMSYTIDVYRGAVRPAERLSDFLAYVALFPQLVAGPIVRYSDIAEQLVVRTHTLAKFETGVFFFALGFAKKTLLANPVGELAVSLFASTGTPGFCDAWGGVLAYAMQIYFDFSGYSDMAIGLGLMLGFTMPENFLSPYRATSITDFWRRWHVTLSSWLRDYLYVPLGGNRRGRGRTYFNLLATMLLGGLWHGAAWTFVSWGAWHGALLAIERALAPLALFSALPRVLRIAGTFVLVCVGWVLFAAPDLASVGRIITGMSGANGLGDWTLRRPWATTWPLAAMTVAVGIAFRGVRTAELAQQLTTTKRLFAITVFWLGTVQMLQQGFNPFLYFRF
jgi:alginate O-acetyltransferase complex protein AlgI